MNDDMFMAFAQSALKETPREIRESLCPFCGLNFLRQNLAVEGNAFFLMCECNARGPAATTLLEAIVLWGERKEPKNAKTS